MSVLLAQFDSRVKEIDLYYDFLDLLVVKRAHITHQAKLDIELDTELEKILKANTFLLLYNLVESSIREALARIYDSIGAENMTYDKLRKELREIWIHDKILPDPTRGPDNSTRLVVELIEKIIAAEMIKFDAKLVQIAGSLDAAKVRDLAKRYGFSSQTPKRARGGALLLLVKTERNNLAHGLKSFAECGRDVTFATLQQAKIQVVVFLRQILANVEAYISNGEYRHI